MAKKSERDLEMAKLQTDLLQMRQELERTKLRVKVLEEREQGWIDAILKLKGVKL